MSEEYIRRNPGDLITAEDWNAMQGEIKKDIANQVGEVQKDLDEFKEAPVDADTFDGKNSSEWIEELDKHYAPLNHDHNGVRQHQRYFLELEQYVNIEGTPAVLLKQLSVPLAIVRLQPAIIQHNMGRNPVVQVYELMDLPIKPLKEEPLSRSYKFCFAGPAHVSADQDPESINFKTKSWDEIHWGDPLETIEEDDVIKVGLIEEIKRNLDEKEKKSLENKLMPDYTLGVWLSNLEKALFEPGPSQYHFDSDDVYRTKWVKDRLSTTVKELQGRGDWPPQFLYRPRLVDAVDLGGFDSLLPLLALLFSKLSGEASNVSDEDAKKLVESVTIGMYEIFHLNMNEVEISPYIFQPYQSKASSLESSQPDQDRTKASPFLPFQPAKAAQFMVLLRS